MRYIIILNEESGKAGKTAPGASPDELRASFAAAGIEADVQAVAPARIDAALKAAVASRPDAVVIGGGDGTVRCAAQALADTGVPLGVLPLGTLNHFAKDLSMPADIPEAVAVLAAGATRKVDLGEVNGHVFINNCSLGAYAEAVRRRDALRDKRGLGKWWAMFRASFEEFRRLRRLRLRIEVGRVIPNAPSANNISSNTRRVGTTRPTPEPTDSNNQPSSRHVDKRRPYIGETNNKQQTTNNRVARPVRTPVVVIGNNRYSGNLFDQNLRPRLDEGRLWLYTVHARRHLTVLRMMFQSLFGKLDEADALAAEAATEIMIESDSGPVPVAADGEVLKLTAPFRFRIRPGALRVLAPSAKDARHEAGGTRHEKNDPEAALTPQASNPTPSSFR